MKLQKEDLDRIGNTCFNTEDGMLAIIADGNMGRFLAIHVREILKLWKGLNFSIRLEDDFNWGDKCDWLIETTMPWDFYVEFFKTLEK